MARNTSEKMPESEPVHAGYDDSDYEWENIQEERPDQIVFDTRGDVYTGMYLRSEIITFTDNKGEEKEFTQLNFRDPGGLKSINAGHELREAFKNIPPNSMVRIELKKFVNTGEQSDMKSYRIDVAKPRGNTQG